jgi:hypothetical protein
MVCRNSCPSDPEVADAEHFSGMSGVASHSEVEAQNQTEVGSEDSKPVSGSFPSGRRSGFNFPESENRIAPTKGHVNRDLS